MTKYFNIISTYLFDDKTIFIKAVHSLFFIEDYCQGCQGIVFTHGVLMGRRAAGKVCPCCISETERCRKLILGRDIG